MAKRAHNFFSIFVRNARREFTETELGASFQQPANAQNNPKNGFCVNFFFQSDSDIIYFDKKSDHMLKVYLQESRRKMR